MAEDVLDNGDNLDGPEEISCPLIPSTAPLQNGRITHAD
jgi:hypothetical protein